MKNSSIGWTDHTFNPWWGCEKVSPACDRCYAETASRRYGHHVWGKDSPRRVFKEKHWTDPLKWDREAEKAGKPALVFCASMADVFEARADLHPWRVKLWDLIEQTPNLRWLLLTKRPEQVIHMLPGSWIREPRLNVWLGITAENQRRLDERMAHLAKVPAAIKWMSYEPALGAIDIREWNLHIDWIIGGGESGYGARMIDLRWFRDLLEQCRSYKIDYFMKQLGGHPDKRKLLEDFPEDLRVQEFPV